MYFRYLSSSTSSSVAAVSGRPENRWLWTIFGVQIVVVLHLVVSVVMVGADDATETKEWMERQDKLTTQTKQKIKEVVCIGKANDEQLTKLDACWSEERKPKVEITPEVEKFVKIIEDTISHCVAENPKDITFEIAKPEHREIVYMLCSNDFQNCAMKKVTQLHEEHFGTTTTSTTTSTTEASPESTTTTAKPDKPMFDPTKHRMHVHKYELCKREVFGIPEN